MLIKRKIITIKSRQVRYTFRRTDRRGVVLVGAHPCGICSRGCNHLSYCMYEHHCRRLYYNFNHTWVYVV